MPTYPTSLPNNFYITGYNQSPQKAFIQSQVDAGRPKKRRRFSAIPENIQGFIVCSTSQLATWKSFWETDLYDGTLSFTWDHPITGNSVSMSPTSTYSVQSHNNSPIYFEVHLELEILP